MKGFSFLLLFLVMMFTIPLSSQDNNLLVNDPLELVQDNYSTPDYLSVDATFNGIEEEFRQETEYDTNYLNYSFEASNSIYSDTPAAPDITVNTYYINNNNIGSNNTINNNLNTNYRSQVPTQRVWTPNIGF